MIAPDGAAPPAPDDGLWLPIAEIARIKNVSRQTIAEHVAKLEGAGKIETRPGPRGTKLVNLAQYNLARNEVGDAARELGAETKSFFDGDDDAPPSGNFTGDPSYRDAQAREKKYRADLAEIEVRQRLGELVPVAKLADDVAKCAEAIVAAIERLPHGADECATAVAREGAAGARAYLKKSARATRVAIVAALQKLVADTQGKDDAALPIDEPVIMLWGDLDPAAHVAPDHA
jgi:DNA-binding MarR family transcriptional regulator